MKGYDHVTITGFNNYPQFFKQLMLETTHSSRRDHHLQCNFRQEELLECN